jgi:hypothetical protein
MTTAATKPHGRPRTPENTALIGALIARQDAMSERTARKLEQLHKAWVPLAGVERLWLAMSRQVRDRFATLPNDFLARRPALADPAEVHTMLRSLILEALEPLADEAEASEVTEAEWPQEPQPTVTRSSTLAAARAQSARLQVDLMRFRARCRHVPLGWPQRRLEKE